MKYYQNINIEYKKDYQEKSKIEKKNIINLWSVPKLWSLCTYSINFNCIWYNVLHQKDAILLHTTRGHV